MNEDYSIVGIDFGTSTTVVRVRNYYGDGRSVQTQALLDHNMRDCFATVILERNGKRKYGNEAEDCSCREFNAGDVVVVYRNFKIDLISTDAECRGRAQNLTRDFLSFVSKKLDEQRYEIELLDKVVAVVSVPAKWPKDVREFMRQVVIDAGFVSDANHVRIVDEPTAASRATLTAHLPDLKRLHILGVGTYNVMMVDMGAGTTDLAVFNLAIDADGGMCVNSLVSYPSVDNPNLCGGREIDVCLCEYVCGVGGRFAVANKRRVEYMVKKFKENLLSPSLRQKEICSWRDESYFELPQFEALKDVDRTFFEDLTRTHWGSWWSIVEGAAHTAEDALGIKPEDVDLLILTGGHSSWYCPEEIFAGKQTCGLRPLPFKKLKENPKRILSEFNRSATVAQGLALSDAVLPFVTTSTNRYTLTISIHGYDEDEHVIVDMNEVLPAYRDIGAEFSIPRGYVEKTIPVNVELRCGDEELSMRPVARTTAEVKPPEHLGTSLPMRLMVKLKTMVDVDYGLKVIGVVTALYVENGKMIGDYKITELDISI